MKRSKNVSLVLMGAMLLSTPACGGGENIDEPQVFRNQQECVAGGFSADQCRAMEEKAKEDAPKFTSREECEKQFGAEMCAGGKESGGNVWMPMLLGFMAGNMLGRSMNSGVAQGLYNDPSKPGQFRTAQGQSVKASPLGRAISRPASGRAPAGAVSRGGFSGGRSIGA